MTRTCTSISTPFLPSLPCTSSNKIKRVRASTLIKCESRKGAHDKNFRGRLVDDNLIVLRKRIHEMKMVERNYEPPSDWMLWEKNCYAGYDEFVYDMIAMLQTKLMDTRPSVALGIVTLVALSVLTMVTLVFFHLVAISKGVLAGFPVG